MNFLELNADIINNTIKMRTDEFEIDSLNSILQSGDFGCAIERNGKQTNYGIVNEDGALVATVLLFIHGDGKLKTIKLTELIVQDDLTDEQKLLVIISCISGIIDLGKTVLNSGNTVRAIKVYGRTDSILNGLQDIELHVKEELSKIQIGVAIEGKWLSFSII